MNIRQTVAEIKATIKEQSTMQLNSANFYETVYSAWEGQNLVNLTISISDDETLTVFRETFKAEDNSPLDTKTITVTDRFTKDKALELMVR